VKSTLPAAAAAGSVAAGSISMLLTHRRLPLPVPLFGESDNCRVVPGSRL